MHLCLTTEVNLQQALLALPACRQEHDAHHGAYAARAAETQLQSVMVKFEASI